MRAKCKSHLKVATERPFLWGLEENKCTDDPAPHLQTWDVLPHLEAASHEAPASHHPDRGSNLSHPTTSLKCPYLVVCPPKIKPGTPSPIKYSTLVAHLMVGAAPILMSKNNLLSICMDLFV